MCETVAHVLNASPRPRIIKHIGHVVMNVQHGNPGSPAPDPPSPERRSRPQVFQHEAGPRVLLVSCTHRPLRHHDNVAEDLFCKVPVFCRSPTTDIGRVEKSRHQQPRVVEHLLAGS